ncbi:hypothetical protein V6Z12_A06G162800 [Gossypium hirsutum]
MLSSRIMLVASFLRSFAAYNQDTGGSNIQFYVHVHALLPTSS